MKITLVPTAGLCNRMNAILCAIVSYEQYRIPTDIYWEKTNDCYAEFNDLFEPLNNTDLIVQPLKKFYLKPGGKKHLFLPNLIRNFIFDVSYNGNKPSVSEQDLKNLIRNKRNIYITSYNRYCIIPPITFPIENIFTPVKDIKNQISKLVEHYYTPHTIGIHIRRTDNLAAIQNNPIEKFIQIMDKEIQENPKTNFYLATDSEKIKQELIEKYKDRIIPTHYTLNRNTEQGMKDAVTELFCLGKTKKIYGCDESTYSRTASRLRQIELIV